MTSAAICLIALAVLVLAFIAFDVWQVRSAKTASAAEANQASDDATAALTTKMQDTAASSDQEVLKGLNDGSF